MRTESGGESRSLTVVHTGSETASVAEGFGPLPVVVIHLAELQTVAGATESDRADQLLTTDDPTVVADIDGV